MIAGGYYVARKGITSLWLTRQLDINFLMTIAALGAAAIGEWGEAALVVFLFGVGRDPGKLHDGPGAQEPSAH